MEEEKWDAILEHPQIVFARTSPQQKLVIVENNQVSRLFFHAFFSIVFLASVLQIHLELDETLPLAILPFRTLCRFVHV